MADNRAGAFSARTSWVSGRGAAVKKPSRRSSGCEESLRAATAVEDEWAPDDVLQLEDLDDAVMLRVLWTRYQKRLIYTWCGGVLISVNPYRDVGAFSAEVATAYAAEEPPLVPHLYATVRHALAAPGSKHAILITGESGAGKTEATRAILSFLAMKHSTADHIRDRLLLSTPVLEAFGNARTRQNANSSRFGKFIEVHMSADLEVVGASLTPYMLEASRVAGALPEGEDTYHIFYLLRSAILTLASGNLPSGNFWARLSRSPEWTELSRMTMNDFASSGRLSSNTMTARRNLDWFEDLCNGLVSLGIAEKEVVECFRLVAAVALLAEPVNQTGPEPKAGHVAAAGPEAGAGPSGATAGVAAVAKLLGASPTELEAFLSSTESWVGGKERLKRARSGLETATLRSSLAQELYAALFSWLTRHVAKGIAPTEHCSGGRALGLLDLYGFEVFVANGFEQFLINYCNERLQQFFNRQVFAAEAEEYRAEGLDDDGKWCQLMLSCQLPALTLLEGGQDPSQIGIFGVVNDRSKTALKGDLGDAATNRGQVAEAIAAKCGKHPAFRRPARDADRRFGVVHFAGEVCYEAGQFVRKNASSHRPDIVDFLRKHGGTFVQIVVGLDGGQENVEPVQSQEKSQKGRKLFGRTLISIFREELGELCATLEARQCRHVRCLRPNDEQAVLVFDDESMLRQCRYSGLLEATRIRRAGYAHRRSQLAFATRYAILLPQARQAVELGEDATVTDECRAICYLAEMHGVATEDLRVGTSKVFLRDASLAWLEAHRERRAAEKVHAALRGFVVRRMVQRLSRIVVVLQAHVRRRSACLLAKRLRREKAVQAAALRIQSFWRGTLTRRHVAEQLGMLHSAGPDVIEQEQEVLEPSSTPSPRQPVQPSCPPLTNSNASLTPAPTSTPVRAQSFDPLARSGFLREISQQPMPHMMRAQIYRNEAMRVLAHFQRVGQDIPMPHHKLPAQLQEACLQLDGPDGPSQDALDNVHQILQALQAVLTKATQKYCRATAAASPAMARATSPDDRPMTPGVATALGAPTPQRSAAASPGLHLNTTVHRTPKIVKRSYSAHSLIRTQVSTPNGHTPAGPGMPRPAVQSSAGAYTPILPRPSGFPHSAVGPAGMPAASSHLPAREGMVLRAPNAVPAMRLWRHLPQPRGGWPHDQRATPKGVASGAFPLRLASLGKLPTPCRARRGASPTAATTVQPVAAAKQGGFMVPANGTTFASPQLVRRTFHVVPRPASANGPPGTAAPRKPVSQEGAMKIPSAMKAILQSRPQHTVQGTTSPRLASFSNSRGCSPTRPAPRPREA